MNTPEVYPPASFDPGRVRGITIDLDDTLWPIWPTIERAERVLAAWLAEHAPAAAALAGSPAALREVRNHIQATRPDLHHDLSALRRESIRLVLERSGDNPALAEPAFDVFFAERQRVELFEDALPALEWLAARYPVVALSNGNADVHRVGLGRHFRAALSAREFGVGKPDPRIFHAGAQAAGAEPQHILHVGDDIHLDGVGGLRAGLQVAWINRHDHLWPEDAPDPHVEVPDLLSLCRLLA